MEYPIVLFVLVFSEFVKLNAGKTADFVTYGSVVKLLNVNYKVRLHSHDVKYGSGSGQQSVTGTQVPEDVNSHWFIKGQGGQVTNRGIPIKCGDTVNLEHLSTGRNLHSHGNFRSPLSSQQEISCYGKDGIGDSGDDWEVVCSGSHWGRGDKVYFRHVDTNMYLCTSRYSYGRPISGQHEICGGMGKSSCASEWKATQGIYIGASDIYTGHIHGEFITDDINNASSIFNGFFENLYGPVEVV